MTGLVVSEAHVIREISPRDTMTADADYYFWCGQSALECIETALHAARKPLADVRRILDLPCGHGRVHRYLKAAFPEAELTACDLDREAVDFCAATFGTTPIYSHEDPARIPLEDAAFDLIWVGSLFTHLDQDRWPGFLRALGAALRPEGVLVFTTGGRAVYESIANGSLNAGLTASLVTVLGHRYQRTGFGYVRYPGSADSYGFTLASPAWVLQQLAHHRGLRLVHAAEAAWVAFQDIYACVNDPAGNTAAPHVSMATYLWNRMVNLWTRA